MKTLLLLLSLSIIMVTNESVAQKDIPNKFYEGENPKPDYEGQYTYVTPERDTMYIESDMFGLFYEVWNLPRNRDEKPVLIKVDSVRRFYATKD